MEVGVKAFKRLMGLSMAIACCGALRCGGETHDDTIRASGDVNGEGGDVSRDGDRGSGVGASRGSDVMRQSDDVSTITSPAGIAVECVATNDFGYIASAEGT